MLFTRSHAVISSPSVRQAGVGMIEVLVTLVIVAIGLLGAANLQLKANAAAMESSQKAQALALLRQMESLVWTGRGDRTSNPRSFDYANYTSTDGSLFFGTNDSYETSLCTNTPLTPIQADLCEWGAALRGAAETTSTGKIGAMIGARGCLIYSPTPPANALADVYVVVVWQGISSTEDPAAGTPGAQCANGVNFNSSNSTGYKRAVSTRVLLPLF